MSLSNHRLGVGFLVLGLGAASSGEALSQTGSKRAPAPKQVKLCVVDGVQVRARLLPMAFDDKGAPRKLATEEIKELRGTDPKVPGYAADYSDLKAGQAVIIYLGRMKTAKPKDGSQADEQLAENNPQSWEPAGQISARLAKIEGPEFAKAKTTPKGKAPNKTIPRQITILADATSAAALQDLSAVMIEILDDRTTK
jgi:hypothetical protein